MRLALELGARYVIDPAAQDVAAECDRITNGMGFDFVFEMSGSPGAAPLCPRRIGKCGCIV